MVIGFFAAATALELAIHGLAESRHLRVEPECRIVESACEADHVLEVGLGGNFESARASLACIRTLVKATVNLAVVRVLVIAGATGNLVVCVFCHPSVRTKLDCLVGLSAFFVEYFTLDNAYDTRIGIELVACNGGVLEIVTAKSVIVIFFIGYGGGRTAIVIVAAGANVKRKNKA